MKITKAHYEQHNADASSIADESYYRQHPQPVDLRDACETVN